MHVDADWGQTLQETTGTGSHLQRFGCFLQHLKRAVRRGRSGSVQFHEELCPSLPIALAYSFSLSIKNVPPRPSPTVSLPHQLKRFVNASPCNTSTLCIPTSAFSANLQREGLALANLSFSPKALSKGFLHAKSQHRELQVFTVLPWLSLEGMMHYCPLFHLDRLPFGSRTQKGREEVANESKQITLLFG